MFDFANGLMLARRTMVLAGVLAVGSCAVWAQADAPPGPPPGPGGMHRGGPERELHELTHVLSLSEAQRTQVKALLEERRQQVEALRNPAGGATAAEAPRPNREQIQAIRQATDTKIAALLNDDQRAKFTAWQQERKERMEHRGGPGGDGPPPPPQSE